MSALPLDEELVKGVSRSFYLTLRMLPASVRGVISLGYLLARASDTIADTATISVETRRRSLERYVVDVRSGAVSPELSELVGEHFAEQAHEGERLLMSRVTEVVAAIAQFTSQEQALLQSVTETITEGQLWDLSYFHGEQARMISDPAQLETYTYQVAGCVGEFWTRVLHLHGYLSGADLGAMCTLGINYGKGLQLTNIIRDIPEDYDNGRIYIPSESPDLEAVIAGSELWISKAQSYLHDAEAYSRGVPAGRLRVATVLPARLGIKTLNLLSQTPPQDRAQKIKITRATVFLELGKAILA